jgi:hypothetical protein
MNQSVKLLDSSDPGQSSVTGYGDESSDFIKGFKFLGEVNDCCLELMKICIELSSLKNDVS